MKLDILLAGVGGQGVILASDVIAETALASGYAAKKTDTIGMAQRGGSVLSHIRIASGVCSPLIKEGEADILLGFEKLESARWGRFLRPGGTAIVNNQELPPPSVNAGSRPYPSDEAVTSILRQNAEAVFYIDGTRLAREVGNARAYNMLLLGCLSVLTPFDADEWKKSITRHLAAGLREINLAAFERGRGEMKTASSSRSSGDFPGGREVSSQ